MANKTYAKEWLTFSLKNLNTAKLLFDVNIEVVKSIL
jgi:hypothetical protein